MEIAKKTIRAYVSYDFNLIQMIDDAMKECRKKYGKNRYFIMSIEISLWNTEKRIVRYDIKVEAETKDDINVFTEFCKSVESEVGRDKFWFNVK